MSPLMDVSDTENTPRWHLVADSELHGKGVFARRFIPKGTTILEYEGKRISSEEADAQPSADPDNPFHTFFFSLRNGMFIDGANDGNNSRWINNSYEHNCEGQVNDVGDRVFIFDKSESESVELIMYN